MNKLGNPLLRCASRVSSSPQTLPQALPLQARACKPGSSLNVRVIQTCEGPLRPISLSQTQDRCFRYLRFFCSSSFMAAMLCSNFASISPSFRSKSSSCFSTRVRVSSTSCDPRDHQRQSEGQSVAIKGAILGAIRGNQRNQRHQQLIISSSSSAHHQQHTRLEQHVEQVIRLHQLLPYVSEPSHGSAEASIGVQHLIAQQRRARRL